MEIIETISIVLGCMIMFYAIVAGIYRVVKGAALWPTIKRTIRLFVDGLFGMG